MRLTEDACGRCGPRTRFQRIEQEPPEVRTHVVLYSGWGPYWWYDPFYPGLVFVHYRPIVIHRPVRDHRR